MAERPTDGKQGEEVNGRSHETGSKQDTKRPMTFLCLLGSFRDRLLPLLSGFRRCGGGVHHHARMERVHQRVPQVRGPADPSAELRHRNRESTRGPRLVGRRRHGSRCHHSKETNRRLNRSRISALMPSSLKNVPERDDDFSSVDLALRA